MRVAVISANVFPCPPVGYSGLEVIAWHCAKGLAELGHTVALIAPDGSTCPGCTMISTGTPGWKEEQGYRHYTNLIPQFDVIIDHSWEKWSYTHPSRPKVLGVLHSPVNNSLPTLPPVEYPCVVCISQDQAAHFKEIHGREAKVCYNGIDLEFYKPLGMPRSDRFLFLGRFSQIKGPHLAIEAAKKAGVGLDMIGDTSITNEPDLLKWCLSHADGKQIKVVGGVNRGETVWWYSQAFAMLHPVQQYREPFGLAPVEAMACGCPVIAWDNGAMRETVGQNGIIVQSVDDMVKGIQHIQEAVANAENNGPPAPYKNLIRSNCRNASYQFSVQNMAKRYEELCKDAVEGRTW